MTVNFINDSGYAAERAEVVRQIIRELKDENLTGPLGKSLEVGSSSGQACYALREEGATEVYGIEPNLIELERSIELGFLERDHAYPQRLEELPELFRQGLFGDTKFDTITSFCFPYLDIKLQFLIKKDPEIQALAKRMDYSSLFSSEKIERWKVEDERTFLDNVNKIIHYLENMLGVLDPSGSIILSTSSNDILPSAFERLGLSYRVHEVKSEGAIEDSVYIAKNK